MENFDKIPRYDTLNLFDKYLQVRQIIGDESLIFYSCEIQKFNRYGFQQDRVLIVTGQYLITLEQGPLNFTEHRKLSIDRVNGMTVSKDENSHEIVIHAKEDYDERYNAGTPEHKRNIQGIMFSIIQARKVECTFFRVPETKLRKYATLKADNQKKNYKRPSSETIVSHYIPEPNFKFSLIQNALTTPTNVDGESVQGVDVIVASEQTDNQDYEKAQLEEKMNQLKLLAHEVLETELNGEASDQEAQYDLTDQLEEIQEPKAQEQQIETKESTTKAAITQESYQEEPENLGAKKNPPINNTTKYSASQTKVVIKPKEPISTMGVASNGLKFGKFGDDFVYIVDLELTLKQIDHYNKSSHSCQIVAVLELDASDSHVAKKLAIANPMAREDCPDSLTSLAQQLSGNKVHKIKETFRAVLKALLDIRVRLPTIFYIDPRLILVNSETFDVQIVLSPVMFERTSPRPADFTLDVLRYYSPEELLTERRELTTPLWTIGCMMYEANYKRSAFSTHLNQKVIADLIKGYPVIFPRSSMFKYDPDLFDCIQQLLEKEPSQRLGSESFEVEVLQHIYFSD